MKRNGVLLVVSAPSGAGKTTLCGMLLAQFPTIHYSISCTTRKMRANERDGVDYYFLDRDEFLRRRDAGEFAEWAEVHNNFYGTPLAMVRQKLACGQDVLLDVDVQGAAQIRKTLPQARLAFIVPPDLRELERRLRKRGLDDEQTILCRLANARDEIREAIWYDALIVNDNLAGAYAALRAFYRACALSPACSAAVLDSMLGESPCRS